MAQMLDSEPLLTPQKIQTWARTKLDTCPVPTILILQGYIDEFGKQTGNLLPILDHLKLVRDTVTGRILKYFLTN